MKKKKRIIPQKMHIKRNDEVIVISGDHKGERGKILKIFPRRLKYDCNMRGSKWRETIIPGRVIIEGVNFVKKYVRPSATNQQGGLVELEAPIHASNVKLWCSKCESGTRARWHLLENEERIRVCVKCGEELK